MKMVTVSSTVGIILRTWIGWKWVIYLWAETKSAHFSSMIFGGENMFVIFVYKITSNMYGVCCVGSNVLKRNVFNGLGTNQQSHRHLCILN